MPDYVGRAPQADFSKPKVAYGVMVENRYSNAAQYLSPLKLAA